MTGLTDPEIKKIVNQEVLISYAWGGESEDFVNKLDRDFQAKGVTIVRDKRDLNFKGRIKAFMEEIGRGKAVIVIVSEKYLKSKNCMFELVQISKNGQFYDRIFPIVLSDANIYNPVQRIKYVQHWEEQIKELDEAIKTVGAANLQGFREDIDLYTEIRATIADLTNILRDMNTLSPSIHAESDFEELFKAIESKIVSSIKSIESKIVDSDTPNHDLLADKNLFQALIQDKTKEFVGREYVFTAIRSFLDQNSKGYFTITGDPGMGKSTILAKYVQDHGCIFHFNVQADGTNRSEHFLENVCRQLIVRYQLPYDPLPSNAVEDGEFLSQLLYEVIQKNSGQPVVIAVDGLDEVDLGNRRDVNILYLPLHLPDGVYFIMSIRRGVEIPFRTHAPVHFFDLLEYQVDSKRDICLYTQNRIKNSEKLRKQIDDRKEMHSAFVEKIADKSENNFMYLYHILSDVENGSYQDLTLEEFPKGLKMYYGFHWERMGMITTPVPVEKIKIIYILGEVREPVSRRKICDYSGENEDVVQQVLDEWEQFLREAMREEKRYSIYHASFRDFLHRNDLLETHPVKLREIYQLITRHELKIWQKMKTILKGKSYE